MGEAISAIKSTICVDRSYFPPYPGYLGELVHHKMWRMGPAEYDLIEIDLWAHPDQKKGRQVSIEDIYRAHVEGRDDVRIRKCLNLQDLLVFKEMDIEVYRKLFGGKSLLFLKSAIRDPYNQLFYIPSLSEYGGKLCDDWFLSKFLVGPSVVVPHFLVW